MKLGTPVILQSLAMVVVCRPFGRVKSRPFDGESEDLPLGKIDSSPSDLKALRALTLLPSMARPAGIRTTGRRPISETVSPRSLTAAVAAPWLVEADLAPCLKGLRPFLVTVRRLKRKTLVVTPILADGVECGVDEDVVDGVAWLAATGWTMEDLHLTVLRENCEYTYMYYCANERKCEGV